MRLRKSLLFLLPAAAIPAAAIAATAYAFTRTKTDLRGKVVLITGGSRGLGLALARRFALEGSKVMICARDAAELDRAAADLRGYTADVQTYVCNVADRGAVERMIQFAIERYGRLDVLVNNAGVMRAGPIATMTLEDYEHAMNVMFWGTVYTTLAALPHLKPGSRIVNITSIGGKISVPHLVPYSCAKFAAMAFSEGIRAELRERGILVTTIAPGLMRTGSHLNAEFKGASDREAALFSLAASLPLVSMSADRAARQIVAATKLGRPHRILGTHANVVARLHGLFPEASADVLGAVNRLLPHSNDPAHRTLGRETSAVRNPLISALTILGNRAAERFLQPA